MRWNSDFEQLDQSNDISSSFGIPSSITPLQPNSLSSLTPNLRKKLIINLIYISELYNIIFKCKKKFFTIELSSGQLQKYCFEIMY